MPRQVAPPAPALQLADNDGDLAAQQANDNDRLEQDMKANWRSHWDVMIDIDGIQNVPASYLPQVLDELTAKKYEWSGNQFYRACFGTDQKNNATGNFKTLKDWMYDGRATTDATWRDTLRSKVGDQRKVPWVPRAKVLALSVFFSAMRGDLNGRSSTVLEKEAIFKECKLQFLLSAQDQVVEDPYWAGFLGELDQDPDQENLYHTVMNMGVEDSPSQENNNMDSGLQSSSQEAPGHRGGNHTKYDLRSSRQANRSNQAGAGEPANQDGEVESAEDRLRRLEEEVVALRRQIRPRE